MGTGKAIANWVRGWGRKRERQAWMDRENMPQELRTATLVASETAIATLRPVPLRGQVDQLYQTTMGGLLLVDSKQRESVRIFWRDVVQLSTYRVILSHTDDERFAGTPVLPRGYIRIANGRKVEYVQVGLLDTEQVVALWFEHWRQKGCAKAA